MPDLPSTDIRGLLGGTGVLGLGAWYFFKWLGPRLDSWLDAAKDREKTRSSELKDAYERLLTSYTDQIAELRAEAQAADERCRGEMEALREQHRIALADIEKRYSADVERAESKALAAIAEQDSLRERLARLERTVQATG